MKKIRAQFQNGNEAEGLGSFGGKAGEPHNFC